MQTVYCENNQRRWDEYLPQVMMAYRASINSTTNQSPNKLVFGRNVVLPLEAVFGRPVLTDDTDDQCEVDEYKIELQNHLETAHAIARRHLQTTSEYQKRHYDIRAKKQAFCPGQAVWLADPSRKAGVCTKLSSKWKGPFLVLKRIDDIT